LKAAKFAKLLEFVAWGTGSLLMVPSWPRVE